MKELDKLDEETKNGWDQAKVKCPNLVGEEHRLMFLRCEVFNEEVSDCYIYPICIVNRIYYDVDSPTVSHALTYTSKYLLLTTASCTKDLQILEQED